MLDITCKDSSPGKMIHSILVLEGSLKYGLVKAPLEKFCLFNYVLEYFVCLDLKAKKIIRVNVWYLDIWVIFLNAFP